MDPTLSLVEKLKNLQTLQQISPFQIGAKVRRYRSPSIYYIREIHENGWILVTKQKQNGTLIEIVNAEHSAAFKLRDDKTAWRDKNGLTAIEAAAKLFKVGDHAIWTILGDIWCVVTEIRKDGSIIVLSSGDHKRFSPTLEHDGDWGWWLENAYPLRKDDGHFHEYTD